MSLKSFLNQAASNAPKKFTGESSEDTSRIQLVYMNAPQNQGLVSFIPIPNAQGDLVTYLYDVMEFQVSRTDDEGNESWRWGKVLQEKDYKSQLTPEQKDIVNKLYSKVYSAIDALGSEWARLKNYALCFGYVIKHTSSEEGELIENGKPKLSLLIMPSKNVANAVKTFAEGLASYGEKGEELYEAVINRNPNNRKYFMELSFKRGSGFGYDVQMSSKEFNYFNSELLPSKEEKDSLSMNIPQELIDKCINTNAVFLGNQETGEDFIPDHIKQLSEQLDAQLSKVMTTENLPPVPPLPNDPNKPVVDQSWS